MLSITEAAHSLISLWYCSSKSLTWSSYCILEIVRAAFAASFDDFLDSRLEKRLSNAAKLATKIAANSDKPSIYFPSHLIIQMTDLSCSTGNCLCQTDVWQKAQVCPLPSFKTQDQTTIF